MLGRHRERTSVRGSSSGGSGGGSSQPPSRSTSVMLLPEDIDTGPRTNRFLRVTKGQGERLGLELVDDGPHVVVSSLAKASPLAGFVAPNDRIVSLDGMVLSAANMAEACVALADLYLVVAPPLAPATTTARGGKLSRSSSAVDSAARQALCPQSQRTVFAAVCPSI